MKSVRYCLLAGLLAAPLVTSAGNLEAEIGVPLEGLTQLQAQRLLQHYVEGKILTFAPKGERIRLLNAVVQALPEGSNERRRAQLALQSARSSSWPS